MIRADWQMTVERPADEVFDFVADLHNEPQFNADASNIVKKTDGAIGLGTVFEEDYKRVGRYLTKIDVYQRPTELGFDAQPEGRRTGAVPLCASRPIGNLRLVHGRAHDEGSDALRRATDGADDPQAD